MLSPFEKMVGKYEGVPLHDKYRIYPAIRRGFCPSRMTSNN